MQIKIIKGYRDSLLRRTVRMDEELTVPESRGQKLIIMGVAEMVMPEADARVAELEAKVTALEAELKKAKKKE